MNEKISIVVPIYKVEKYLDKCVESIVSQTYKNIEIVLVDDGSPDNCPKMCDKWKKKDNRIVVIHKSNGGLSDARNSGIMSSTGKYICFVDSDDYIENDYVETLLDSIITNKTMIAQCGINYVDENGLKIDSIGYNTNACLSNKQMLLDSFYDHVVENTVAWNRLYDIKLFKKVKFPFGKIHEDEFTTYKLFYSCKKISVVDKKLYNYRQSSNSITRSTFNIKRLDALDAFKEKIAFFESKNEKELTELSVTIYLNTIKSFYYELLKNNISDKKILNNLKKDFKNEFNKYKYVSKINNIKNKLFIISPRMFVIIKKIFK